MGSIYQVGAWDHHFIYLACHNYKSSFIPEYNLRPLPRFSLWPAGERVPWHLERENEVWWHSVGEGYVCVNCVDLVVNSPKAIWMECWYHISKRYSQRQRQNCMHTQRYTNTQKLCIQRHTIHTHIPKHTQAHSQIRGTLGDPRWRSFNMYANVFESFFLLGFWKKKMLIPNVWKRERRERH